MDESEAVVEEFGLGEFDVTDDDLGNVLVEMMVTQRPTTIVSILVPKEKERRCWRKKPMAFEDDAWLILVFEDNAFLEEVGNEADGAFLRLIARC